MSDADGRIIHKWRLEMPMCPTLSCVRTMESLGVHGMDLTTGLETFFCPVCRHQRFVSRHGLRVLWCDSREYVYSYGPSPARLVIILSAAARAQCGAFAWTASDLSAAVARWTLLRGCLSGTVLLDEPLFRLHQFNTYLARLKAVPGWDDAAVEERCLTAKASDERRP